MQMDILTKPPAARPSHTGPHRVHRLLLYLIWLGILAQASNLHAQDGIAAAKLAKLKASTVFVKVTTGEIVASGSGFVVDTRGDSVYVVTNRHVVRPTEGAPRPPIQQNPSLGTSLTNRPTVNSPIIVLVFRSGTPDEQTVPAHLEGMDPERDLAVLRATNVRNIPSPIDLSSVPEPKETMAVWVLGFPPINTLPSNQGNPALTIGKGLASSLRRNKELGTFANLVVDTAVNPGNRGGPIVDTEGRLIGVATIAGNGVGVALPAEQLLELLGGRIRVEQFTARAVANGKAEI
jgi:S1-C subfamily serine protease